MTSNRLFAIAALVVSLGVAGLGTAAILMPHGPSSGNAAVGGPFALTSQDGTTVTQDALLGHPTLVFFGYTHCPDVCPTTLADISSVFKALGDDEKARAIFVTVDPQRDTPVVLKDYMTSFDPRITALTGTPEAIKAVEREYKVYAKAVPDKDGTYTMDHTAITYLMDKDGKFVSAFNLDRPAQQSAAELKSYF
jgi:protein SCO1